MNPETITSLISTVGFPIVMVGVLCWFIWWRTNAFSQTLKEIEEDLIHIKGSLNIKDNGNS